MTDKLNKNPGSQSSSEAEQAKPDSKPSPFYKQPGMIAAGILVLLALVLLIIWLAGGKANSKLEATRTIGAPMVLVATDDDPAPLAELTETSAIGPTEVPHTYTDSNSSH